MTKTRQKKVLVANVTTERMNEAFENYAKADAQIQKINAQMDIKITEIRAKYQDDISKNEATKEESFEVMQVYAQEHPELFTKKKSLETAHGILGFRTGTPTLKTRKGFTWAAVTECLKNFLPSYVRTKDEPMKDKLLADRDQEGMEEMFRKVGVCVEQAETFYVEPKKEEN